MKAGFRIRRFTKILAELFVYFCLINTIWVPGLAWKQKLNTIDGLLSLQSGVVLATRALFQLIISLLHNSNLTDGY